MFASSHSFPLKSLLLFQPVSLLLALFFALLTSISVTSALQAATIPVGTTNDGQAADGVCSLREAIRAANEDKVINECTAGFGEDVIDLSALNGTINLTGGELAIFRPITITGPGVSKLTVSAGDKSRVLRTTAPLVLQGFTVADGKSGAEGGGLSAQYALTLTNMVFTNNQGRTGGGVAALDTLTLNNVQFISNTAITEGGGLHVKGKATVTDATFVRNTARSDGGGALFSSEAQLSKVEFQENTATNNGGGAKFLANSLVADGSFIGNSALTKQGGGLWANGTTEISGVRFLNNRAASGGGAAIAGTATINRALWLGNQADLTGGAIYLASSGATAGAIVNTLFARNQAGVEGAALFFAAAANMELLHTTIASPTVTAGAAVVVQGGYVGITNTIFANYSVGISQTGGTVYQDHNMFSAATSETLGSVTTGGHSFVGAAGFIDPATDNYHLAVSSNAYEAGVNLGLSEDFDGDPRPQGSATDIGYDETAYLLPAIDVNFASVSEGNSGTSVLNFTLTLAVPRVITSSVHYFTSDKTATAGVDYIGVSDGVAEIPPGQLSTKVAISVIGDIVVEATETFSITLTNPRHATIGAGFGLGTIIDEDTTSISVGDSSVVESNEDSTSLVFTLTLSAPSDFPVTVTYVTSEGTAATGTDYVAVNGTLTISPLQTVALITIPIKGDTQRESAENFILTLTRVTGAAVGDKVAIGTIIDDDTPTVSISDTSVVEGNSGKANAVFTVTLSQPVPEVVRVDYQTTSGRATMENDFVLTSGTLTFTPQQTNQTIIVPVTGDVEGEGDESFMLTLSNPVNIVLGDETGVATIIDDDNATNSVYLPVVQNDGQISK